MVFLIKPECLIFILVMEVSSFTTRESGGIGLSRGGGDYGVF